LTDDLFANGIAAMSASGGYGPCRVAEAIIGHADLTIGGRVREVLKAEQLLWRPVLNKSSGDPWFDM
jgi:hypothetical protein